MESFNYSSEEKGLLSKFLLKQTASLLRKGGCLLSVQCFHLRYLQSDVSIASQS
jgi:hypothetical protein